MNITTKPNAFSTGTPRLSVNPSPSFAAAQNKTCDTPSNSLAIIN
jgi:hypothetical protein